MLVRNLEQERLQELVDLASGILFCSEEQVILKLHSTLNLDANFNNLQSVIGLNGAHQ